MAETWRIFRDLDVTSNWLLGGDFSMSLTLEENFSINSHISLERENLEFEGLTIKHSLSDLVKHLGFTSCKLKEYFERRVSILDRVHFLESGFSLGSGSLSLSMEGSIYAHKIHKLIFSPPSSSFKKSPSFRLNTSHLSHPSTFKIVKFICLYASPYFPNPLDW